MHTRLNSRLAEPHNGLVHVEDRCTLISRALRFLPLSLYARVPSAVSAQLTTQSWCRRCMQDIVKCTWNMNSTAGSEAAACTCSQHAPDAADTHKWHASAGCRVSVDCTSLRRATRSVAGEQQHAKATASTMTLLLPAPFLCMYQHHASGVLITMAQPCNR